MSVLCFDLVIIMVHAAVCVLFSPQCPSSHYSSDMMQLR
jgi:hypothetical protein